MLVGNPTEVLSAEVKVSGTSPMFPKWATGFTNTQWGWPDKTKTVEDQLKAVIDMYRAKEIPIDNFCLDVDWKTWSPGADYNEFTWNAKNFQRAMHEGQTAYTSAQRVWSINRNYYAGAQRYRYGLWSGDIKSGFPAMKLQKERLIAAVNLG